MDKLSRISLAGAIFCLVALLWCSIAWSHTEEGEQVAYPSDCCGGNDCAPIITMVRLPNGDMVVTTKHGTKVFPKDFPWRYFESSKSHACFSATTNYCLLAPAGT